MHPAAWFAWAVSAGAVVITTTNPFYLLPVFGATWLVHAAHMRAGPNARSFRFFVIFGLVTIVTRTALVFFGRVSEEAVAAAFLEGLRLAVLLAVFGTFNSVSDPFRVLRLAPRRFHEAALAAALALSLTPRTIDALGRVREAQRLRGMDTKPWRSWTALAIPVLAGGMEEAVTLAETMDSRGHGRGRRTSYRPESWSFSSIAIVATSVVAATAFILFALRGEGALLVSTFPLLWPEASAVLVGMALVLSFPAFLRAADRR